MSARGQTFGQRQPPLYVAIQKILDKYPDGQIFKEMIQNADDAGASTVHFYLDNRQHGTCSLVEPALGRFQGPALMAYNDALFTDEDWQSIQDMQQSVKTEDPFKVGKYGIGFNSVYHITDLPTILSGKKLAYLEPHEEIWTKETGQLYIIQEHVNKVDTFAPFHERHNFSIGDYEFPGTFFRFPLRNSSRERRVSSHIYNVEKLCDLLTALREEAKVILLFLRWVRTVEVHEISENGFCSDLLKVSVEDVHDNQHQKRLKFYRDLKGAFENKSFEISHSITLTLHIRVLVRDEINQSDSSQSDWLVASRVGSQCMEVHDVATELKALPWVGIALEMASAPSGGRVFCVLPMPCEVSCYLPVHVNATFSLNDERRELKWAGIERTNDNSAKWNNLVIKHLLPRCYASLLLICAKSNYLSVENFYGAWPDIMQVRHTHWEDILTPLFKYIFSESAEVFWSHGHWINRNKALFTPRDAELPSVVTEVLSACGEQLVTIPAKVWDALTFMHISVVTTNPTRTRSKLRQRSDSYKMYPPDKKLTLLRYCLSDDAFNDLSGIALLPLADGTFTTFVGKSPYHAPPASVYLCSSQCPRYLTPGCESELVDIESDDELFQKLLNLSQSKHTQLKLLDSSGVAHLLEKVMPARNVSLVTLPHPKVSLEWLEKFWKWVAGQCLELFSNHLVVPVYDSLSCTQAVVRLSQASPSVFIPSTACVSHHIMSALSKFHVRCCKQSEFPFVCVPNASLMNHFSADGVLSAIGNAQKLTNVLVTAQEASELRQFLYKYSPTPQRKAVLQELTLFTTLLNSEERLYSISQAKQETLPGNAQVEPLNFPLSSGNLHPQVILFACSDYYQLWLLQSLSVLRSTTIDLLVNSAFPLIRSGVINRLQAQNIMKELLENVHMVCSKANSKQREKLKTEISSLPFLPVGNNSLKSPSSLFDPSDSDLQNLFEEKSVFPQYPFTSEKCLAVLRSCGLKTTVSPQEIIDVILEIGLSAAGGQAQCVSDTTYTRAQAVLKYIQEWDRQKLSESVTIGVSRSRYPFSRALAYLSQKRCWLPVQATPSQGYPDSLGWKATNCTRHLISFGSSVILHHNQAVFEFACGTQMYFIDHSLPADMCELFPLDPNTLVKHVILHLHVVISSQLTQTHARTITQAIYHLLKEHLYYTKQHAASLPTTCVWISRHNVFVSPSVVALQQNSSFRQNLEPFIYTLPDDLVEFSSLFTTVGVVEVVSKTQIIGILGKIRNGSSMSLGVNDEEAWELVMTILNWLTGNGEHFVDASDCETLYVPVDSNSSWPTLVKSRCVVYTDSDFLRHYVGASQSTELSYMFVNRRISSQMAHQLRLTPLSQHLDIAEDAFEDVGPSEPLTVRLKNILKDYKDGLTIVKELLQNADDAGATEMNICYDARYHRVKPESLLFPGMARCHGPALVAHNNAMFTRDDFKNITKLAGATKEDQALKIGKFGVGFCSVYHMTDIPSFVSNQYLYVFDPTLTYLKEEIKNPAKPGKKVSFTASFISNSQQLAPYTGLFGFKQEHPYKGTIFRFPFRTSPSELSDKIYTADVVRQMSQDIQNCSSELLLFLQKINCITVSQINDGQESPSVQVTINKTTLNHGLVCIHKITCSLDENTTTSFWLAATHTQTVLKRIATASVACSLLDLAPSCFTSQPTEGEVFCFLPLSMKTGLPIHISSNFAVSNNRTGIWTSDDSSRNIQEVTWNITLMTTVIPRAYFELLRSVKQMNANKKVKEYMFHSLWPLKTSLKVHNPWILLIEALYHGIENSTLFFSACTGEWLSLTDSRFLSSDILKHSLSSLTLPECVLEVVNCLKLPVVDLPQEYHAELSLDQCIITEEVFLKYFFCEMEKITSIARRNEVLCLTLECFASELDWSAEKRFIYLHHYLQSNPCIPCAPDGQHLRKCSEMINPNAEFAKLFEEKDRLFPLESFCQKQLVLKAMEILGMKCTYIPMQMLIERAKTVSLLYNHDKFKALERVRLILKCLRPEMMSTDGSETSIDSLADIPFLPVMPKPEGYPLVWFGENKQLLSGKELMLKGETSHFGDTRTNMYIAGSQVPFTCEVQPENGGCGYLDYSTRKTLKIRVSPTSGEIIAHFKHLINAFVSQKANSDKMMKESDAIARQVYKYLENTLRKQESTVQGASETSSNTTELDVSTLSTYPCVWTGRKFIDCDKVAQEWKLKDGPYLYRIPDGLDKENLRKALDIKNRFTVDDLIKALQQLSNDFGSKELPDNCQLLLREIISELNTAEIPQEHPPIMLPDNRFIMHEVSSLAFNDAQWRKHEEGYTYVNHSLVTRDLAQKLGVNMVRSKVLADYRFRKTQVPMDCKKFGQHENLTSRIHGILEDYPFDVTILKELLQNADDARATKLYVILDKRMHRGERVLSEHWQELQGPALLVWNDKEFSEADIEGIQKIGVGNKQSDSEKIGQYGIGFNSVYHLTDCPSFLSGGNTLCIFDPHCKYTPDSTSEFPGDRFNVGTKFWDNFPDMKPAYFRSNLMNCPKELLKGSLFRFPLRYTQELVDVSEIIGGEGGQGIFTGILSADEMHNHLKIWAPKMKQSMFFLNHVTEIKFFVIATETNSLKMEYHYRVDIDKPAMAKRAELHKKISEFKDRKGAEPCLMKYQMTLVEVIAGKEQKEQWLIQQGIGDVENREQEWHYIHQVKPRHGIAVPMNLPKDAGRFCGKVFCFLPLPVNCNLPVHINGHFILNSSRRMLWKTTDSDDLDNKQKWNEFLLKAIAVSYARLLMKAKQDFKCEGGEIVMKDMYRYYNVFPRWTAPQPRRLSSPAATAAEPNSSSTVAKHCQVQNLSSVHQKHHMSQSISHKRTSAVVSREHVHAAPTKLPSTSTHGKFPVTSSSQTSDSGEGTPALPTNEWLELAKNVFRVLAASNAHVIVVIDSVPISPGENERSYYYKHVEWCPLRNKDCPASQAYFVSSTMEHNLKSVLTRVGMKLSCTPQWIRKHFGNVNCSIPTVTAKEAYDYYSKFYKNILSTESSFPCPISETSFKSVEDFNTFITYILPANPVESTENNGGIPTPAVDSPLLDAADTLPGKSPKSNEDAPSLTVILPLIVTADELLRFSPADSGSKVIRSNFSCMFPEYLQWFLHPQLTKVPYSVETFLTSQHEEDEKICLERIEVCLASILPPSLAKTACVQCGKLKASFLTKVWKCLSEDDLFNHFLNKILENWALLLSRDNKLYSSYSVEDAIVPILPLTSTREQTQTQPSVEDDDECEEISMNMLKKVSTVLEHLNLPFLNTSVVPPKAVECICPTLCVPVFILQGLYYFHCKSDISHQITEDMSRILIEYFGNIHLKKDTQSLKYLRGLPLFLTHMGRFTSLSGRTVYEWPAEMCTDGQDTWLNEQNVVFLDCKGAWSSLSLREELYVHIISIAEIYTLLIFERFRDMDEKLRYNHLRYIRDSVLKDAIAQSELRRSDRKRVSLNFIDELKDLKCIGSDNRFLSSIQELYDYKNTIFQTFKENFSFLPEFFIKGMFLKRSRELTEEEQRVAEEHDRWREFFISLDLHSKVTPKDFLKLCHEMGNGWHTRNTRKKSTVLFEYLFKPEAKEWLMDKKFLSKVVDIHFVLADKGEGLTWIAPLERRETLPIQAKNDDTVYLTKLKGACTYDDVKLVWSVKPVYRVPYFRGSSVLADLQLQLEYRATVVDVIKHLSNISETGRADPTLFDTYTAITPTEKDISLVTIIAECFEFFNKLLLSSVQDNCKLKDSDIHILEMTPCVPVQATTKDKIVLVRPCQALTTDHAHKYYPYLHQIPNELKGSSKLLEKIQVKSSIQLCHLQLVLELVYAQLKNEAMDPNTMKIVCHAIRDIIHLHTPNNDKTAVQLSPLFLPGHDLKLHNSLCLVYPDTYSYKDCQLPARGTGYFLFHYPGTCEDHFDFAKKFCNSLPTAVRPKPLSEICCQQLTAECMPLLEDNEMARSLKKALTLSGLPAACCLAFLKHGVACETLEAILTGFFKRVKVLTVQNLEVNVLLKKDMFSILGTTKVDFYLEQKEGDNAPSFCLYLDFAIGRVAEEHIHKTVAQELLGAIGKIVKNIPSGIFSQEDVQETFRLFLKAQSDNEIRKACQLRGIGLNDPYLQLQTLVPVVGKTIPEEWHHMLDQNTQHLFHPQELVGYELGKGCYIFAEVLYVILPEDFQTMENAMDPLQTQYMICISEGDKETTKVVTALDIHKFLKGQTNNSSAEDQEGIPHEDEEDRAYQNVADAKRQLCQELKRIWQLTEPEKSKAIRRLFLQWHPDKNLDNLEMADEVFKFLMKQIERLERGLEPTEDDDDDEFSPSPYWEERYTDWNQTAKAHKTHRQRHADYFRNQRGSGFGDVMEGFAKPQRNVNEAQLWVQQADIDFRALEALYESAKSDQMLSSHVCFMAHEIAEKALKGGMYATCGLSPKYLANHDICTHAHSLRGERMQLASELPALTIPLDQYYLSTRFPNRYTPSAVPSHRYSIAAAREAHENARKILAIVHQIIDL